MLNILKSADAAGNVAQLMTLILQTAPAETRTPLAPSRALDTLLQCVGASHGQATDPAAQMQVLHASMLGHTARAAAAFLTVRILTHSIIANE